jgi:tetratricopeptide (TPR) repeat protein
MAPNVPTFRQLSLLALVPQIILIGLLVFLYDLAKIDEPFIFGALTYSLLAFALRNIVAKSHRQGIRLVKNHKFAEAIPYFENSVQYFNNNNWVDKYRYLTLLSSSKMTYKEMGLCNMAFCYSQIGNGQKAKAYYEQVLKAFPENGLAIAGLNMLRSVDPKAQGDG